MAESSPRLTARALKVLAHPLRIRLLGQLRVAGPATATTLAAALGTNSGATSYHLRKLAEVDLVTETGQRHGRQRWWRASTEMHSWFASDLDDDPDGAATAEWLHGESVRIFQRYAERWLSSQAEWSPEWRDASGASDYGLQLSAPQLRDLLDEISAVIARYRTGPPDTDAAQVMLFLHAFPQLPKASS